LASPSPTPRPNPATPPKDAASADGAAPAKRFAAFKFNSVGSQFKRQLGELMAQLGRMEPHYIRCIKPNSANAPAL
jgi:myosin-5